MDGVILMAVPLLAGTCLGFLMGWIVRGRGDE